jgi:phospholipid/cholesterol/gamma-HCH transport system substrate-binding protein
METRASTIAVGSFVLALAALLAVFVFWLGGYSLSEQTSRYLILFEGTVTGLQQGSPVRFRGVPVGQVTDIRLDPADARRVQVTIEVDPATPINQESIATLEVQGITGGAYVLIAGETGPAPAIAADPARGLPVIASHPSTLQAVVESIPQLLDTTSDLIERASGLLTEENQKALADTLANLRDFSATVAGMSGSIERTVARVESAAGNIDGLVSELRVDAARLSDRADAILADADAGVATATTEIQAVSAAAREALAAYTQVGREVTAILEENRSGLRDFTGSGLYEFSLMVSELRGLAQSLTRVSEQISRDPAQLLRGTSQGVRPQ